MRKTVEKNLERLRISLYCIIKKRSKQFSNSSKPNEIKKEIILDLRNLLNHVFGSHEACSSRQFKCTRSKNDINYVEDLKLCGLWAGLKNAVRLVLEHVDSLLHNVNNNLAERYNSIVAKFIGGKRCNFVMRDSYEARCKAAAASFNDRSKFYKKVTKQVIQHSPTGKYLKNYMSQIKRRKELRCKRKLILETKKNYKTIRKTTTADQHYGRMELDIDVPDMSPEIYKLKEQEFLKKLEKSLKEIADLERETRGQSANMIWRSERLKRLTASNFGQICKMRDRTPRTKTVINILYKKICTFSTSWGKDNEPLALEKIRNALPQHLISECGFFVHSSEPFLGASPDGLVDDNGIIEIKCPFSAKEFRTVLEAAQNRKVTGCAVYNNQLVLKTNSNYYYQIQGQLEVTNRDFCLFCVWIPNDFVIQKIERNPEFWNDKMLPKLKKFYFDHLLPELIDSRYNRNKDIR